MQMNSKNKKSNSSSSSDLLRNKSHFGGQFQSKSALFTIDRNVIYKKNMGSINYQKTTMFCFLFVCFSVQIIFKHTTVSCVDQIMHLLLPNCLKT